MSGVKKNITQSKFNTVIEYFQSNPKQILFRVVALLLLFWFLFDDYGILKRVRMEIEYGSLLERYTIEQQKMLDNEQRIQHAREPDSIEKAARERYNFRKSGETLFIIRGE